MHVETQPANRSASFGPRKALAKASGTQVFPKQQGYLSRNRSACSFATSHM